MLVFFSSRIKHSVDSMSTTTALHRMMAESQRNHTSRISKRTTRPRYIASKRTKHSKSTCPITRSNCYNTEVSSKKMFRMTWVL
uniref:Uncharacterized protein n=2 Tax=Physcomitrium patens TaxID=3218 RepID=A0A2K1K866_PHYPA|nr:hypothetical protein PHYPA_011856 [Physcomitrium patens]